MGVGEEEENSGNKKNASVFLPYFSSSNLDIYWHRIAKNGLEMGYFGCRCLIKINIIQNDDILAFPGHSVVFRGNICLDFVKTVLNN